MNLPSKRYINEKIEEFFSDKISNSRPPLQRRPLKLFFLGIFLILIVIGWIVFLKIFYESEKKIQLISLNKVYDWGSIHPIISTPVLLDLNDDKTSDLVYGDLEGNIFALNIKDKKNIFEFKLIDGVFSSLSKIEANQKVGIEILIIDKTGNFYVLNKEGNYLYRSRKEFFNEPIWNKGVFLKSQKDIKNGLLFFTSRKGSVWAVDPPYGEVVWENKNSPLYNEEIFASPLLVENSFSTELTPHLEKSLLIVSEGGQVVLLDIKTGFLKWSMSLGEKIKSSPLFLKKFGEGLIFIISSKGFFYFLNLQGELVKKGRIEDNFVSTPAKLFLKKETTPTIILSSLTGNFYSLRYDKVNLKVDIDSFYQNSRMSFVSSPVVADFDLDGGDDFISITRDGEVLLFNGESFNLFFEPFLLKTKVSATPLLADTSGDRNLEIVVAREDGLVSLLTLKTSPENAFEKNIILYGEF